MGSRNGAGVQVGRLAGCLWLALAAFGFIFIAGAAGVGVDAGFVLLPLILVPICFAILVFVGGTTSWVLAASALAGLAYAALGVWNFVRAADFERTHPGSVEISGGEPSLSFILLALAIALWSATAAVISRRRA
ncbi:MAG: hypothetical protein ACJ77I_09425 [Chloroflexota bacterium]